MKEVLDASIFPTCTDATCKEGIASGKIIDTCGICLGPTGLESAKKTVPR